MGADMGKVLGGDDANQIGGIPPPQEMKPRYSKTSLARRHHQPLVNVSLRKTFVLLMYLVPALDTK